MARSKMTRSELANRSGKRVVPAFQIQIGGLISMSSSQRECRGQSYSMRSGHDQAVEAPSPQLSNPCRPVLRALSSQFSIFKIDNPKSKLGTAVGELRNNFACSSHLDTLSVKCGATRC